MMFVTEGNKEYVFESFEAYVKWDAERCRKIKEEKEKKEKADREAKLARLTEEDKKKIKDLEKEIDWILLGTDFLSFGEKQRIEKIEREIREIRGF